MDSWLIFAFAMNTFAYCSHSYFSNRARIHVITLRNSYFSFISGSLRGNVMSAGRIDNSNIVSISLSPELFQMLLTNDSSVGLVFTMYSSSVLFPPADISQLFPEADDASTFTIGSSVVGVSIAGYDTTELPENFTISMGIRYDDPVS